MGFLSSFRGEERVSSTHSDLSDSTHVSVGATLVPRIKSEFVPKNQAPFDTARHEAAAGQWDDASPLDGSPLQAVMRTSTLGKSFSSATSSVRRNIFPRLTVEKQPERSLSDIQYTSINQFQQRVELYRGSISTVYKAVCAATQMSLIIKAYEKSKMKPKNLARLEREIHLMRRLGGGDGLVDLHAVFEDSAFKYLIMEHCKGGDLFKVLMMKGGTLDEAWVCREIIAPLLTILARMHKDTIIHRDIKPENIFLTASMKFKLGDFGLAIKADEELPFTRSGTLDYMAPEVLGNHTSDLQESPQLTRAQLKMNSIRPYDEKVDVWAAGVLAYECVVGKPPFEVNDEVQTATLIMYSNKIYFPQRHSPEWRDFVRIALEKKPHLRPSAAALLDHPWIRLHAPQRLQESASQKLEATVPIHSAPESATSAPLPADGLPAARLSTAQYPNTAVRLSSLSKGSSSNLDTDMPSAFSSSPFGDPRQQSKIQVKPLSSELSSEGSGRIKAMFPPGPSKPSSLSKALQAAQSSRDVHNEKPPPLSISRAGSGHLVETPGSSFTALLNRAALDPPSYVDSAEVVEGADLSKNGLRIRIKTYFNRQRAVEVPMP